MEFGMVQRPAAQGAQRLASRPRHPDPLHQHQPLFLVVVDRGPCDLAEPTLLEVRGEMVLEQSCVERAGVRDDLHGMLREEAAGELTEQGVSFFDWGRVRGRDAHTRLHLGLEVLELDLSAPVGPALACQAAPLVAPDPVLIEESNGQADVASLARPGHDVAGLRSPPAAPSRPRARGNRLVASRTVSLRRHEGEPYARRIAVGGTGRDVKRRRPFLRCSVGLGTDTRSVTSLLRCCSGLSCASTILGSNRSRAFGPSPSLITPRRR